MGCSKKDPYPKRKFQPSGEGELSKECLKFVKNAGRGGIVNFLHGGYGSFLERPNDIKINMVLNGAYNHLQ